MVFPFEEYDSSLEKKISSFVHFYPRCDPESLISFTPFKNKKNVYHHSSSMNRAFIPLFDFLNYG